MKRVFPFLECGMCGRANDNMCDDCVSCLQDIHTEQCAPAEPMEQRRWVGSGEDGNLYQDFLREYA